MRKKIIITFIMTLAVIIGGWLYYDNLMAKQKGSNGYYVISAMEMENTYAEIPKAKQVVSTVKPPKYRALSRRITSGSDSLPVIIEKLADPSLLASKGIAQQRAGINNSRYKVENSRNKTNLYHTGSAGGLLAHSGGKGSLSGTSGAGAASSGMVGMSASALLAPKSGNFTAANGYTDITSNPDDTDDGLPPPVGAPVGEGLMVLLLLTGVYIFYKRKY